MIHERGREVVNNPFDGRPGVLGRIRLHRLRDSKQLLESIVELAMLVQCSREEPFARHRLDLGKHDGLFDVVMVVDGLDPCADIG